MALHLKPYQSQSDRFDQWRKVMKDFVGAHWIVPDQTCKNQLQKKMWTDGVRRLEANISQSKQFWLEAALRSHLDFELISPAVLQILIRKLSRDHKIPWLQSSSSMNRLAKFLELLAPIFATENTETFEQWLNENRDSVESWGVWYFAARELWGVLQEQGWFPATLSESLLLKEMRTPQGPLVFDLGYAMDFITAQLIQSLSRNTEVVVLIPNSVAPEPFCVWAEAYGRLGFKDWTVSGELASTHEFLRLPSALSSIKQATGQLRQWMEQGIDPHKILVCGTLSDAEKNILNEHLKWEGFPSSADLDPGISQALDLVSLFSQLRVLSQDATPADLEWLKFSGVPENEQRSFDDFLRLWRNIYDSGRLRVSKPSPAQEAILNSQDEISLEDWVQLVLPLINTEGHATSRDLVIQLLQRSALHVPESLRLDFQDWLSVLSAEAMPMLRYEEGRAEHFQFAEWSQWNFFEFDAFIAMDCSSQQLVNERDVLVSVAELLKIERDLGLGLKGADPERHRSTLKSLSCEAKKPGQFYYANADVEGSLQRPDAVWLQNYIRIHGDKEVIASPPVTRWDAITDSKEEQFKTARLGLQADLGEVIRFDSTKPDYRGQWKLSASQVEKTLECAFVFMAGKGFKLSDKPDLDLDVDAMTGGNWFHIVLKFVKERQWTTSVKDKEIDQLFEELKPEVQESLYDDFMWPILKRKTARIVKRFLESEQELKQEFPQSQFEAGELDWKASWSREKKDLVPEGQGDVPFSGRIDRVDIGPDGARVIYDYKSSGGGTHNHKVWMEHDELQLLLYAYATEKGFLKDRKPGDVAGAYYYALKEMKRDKGMAVDNSTLGPVTSHNSVSVETKQTLYQNMLSKIDQVVQEIESGRFYPQPKDEKDCPDCKWKNLCRAPHLN